MEAESSASDAPAAADVLTLLRSEAKYVALLSMIQALFIEPVVPLKRPAAFEEVFASLRPVVALHELSWPALEPLLEKPEAAEALEAFALGLLPLVDLWTVYIPFMVGHERAQHALRVLVETDPAFARTVAEASTLRPGASVTSALQLVRVRPYQMRRYLRQLVRVLLPYGERHRRGLWAANTCIRVLGQFCETARLECASGVDATFKAALEKEVGEQLFSRDASVLWRGDVRMETDKPLRLVVTSDEIVLLQRRGMLSWYTWEVALLWRVDADGGRPCSVSGSLFSAVQRGAAPGAPMWGVHIVTHGGRPRRGADLRVLLRDKLGATALVSWTKELRSQLEERFGGPNAALGHSGGLGESGDGDGAGVDHARLLEWDPDTMGGPEPQLRRYVNRSPVELAAILQQLRADFEHASAIRIESPGARVVRERGVETVMRIVLPLATGLAVLKCGSMEHWATLCCAYSSDDWKPLFDALLRQKVHSSRADTLFRENTALMNFMSAYLNRAGDMYLEKLLSDPSQTLDELHHAVLTVPPPAPVRELLSTVYHAVRAYEPLQAHAMRAVGNLFFLRMLAPTAVHNGNRALAKAIMSTLASSPELEAFWEALCAGGGSAIDDRDAFASDSFASLSIAQYDPTALAIQSMDAVCANAHIGIPDRLLQLAGPAMKPHIDGSSVGELCFPQSNTSISQRSPSSWRAHRTAKPPSDKENGID